MKLKQIYEDTVVPKLMEEFGITNKMAVPRILKVVVNTGVKEGASDKGVIEKAAEQIAVITGQRAKVARAKKSIANFKLREGAPIGLAVTLRGTRMYDFLTKLINIVLPKVRDFQG
ncbi:50S ribosomal protein L5, partial [Candidatus Amesbacteria bacterium]|nr:50S ribosomal protein L5 [Candidatus Amesbacteria bacterium]